MSVNAEISIHIIEDLPAALSNFTASLDAICDVDLKEFRETSLEGIL